MTAFRLEPKIKSSDQVCVQFVDIRSPLWLTGSNQNANESLQQLFNEAGSCFIDLRNAHLIETSTISGIIIIQVRRNLGSVSWPDSVWMENSVQIRVASVLC